MAEIGASRGSVITYVNPAVSVLLGVTLLAEPLNIAIIAGFLLIIVGSWLSTGGVLPPLLKHLLRTTRRQPISRVTEVSKLAVPPRKKDRKVEQGGKGHG